MWQEVKYNNESVASIKRFHSIEQSPVLVYVHFEKVAEMLIFPRNPILFYALSPERVVLELFKDTLDTTVELLVFFSGIF